jgi:glycine/D-amino acid oxidase-like deaminating enzyme
MSEHRSPWWDGLTTDRAVDPLQGNERTDVAIIGGGIAGLSTAFELLERSDLNVMVIEADRIAHGASGNGSGQVTPSFEGGFLALADRFGTDLAKAAFRQTALSKRRFGEMAKEAGATDQVRRANIHIGFSSIDMAEELGRSLNGEIASVLPSMRMYAASGSGWNCELRGRGIRVERVPPETIRQMLGTDDDSYKAAAIARTSIANIPAICEGLVRNMRTRFPHRFILHESTKVLGLNSIQPVPVECERGQVECQRAVICTNGYLLPDLLRIPNSMPDGFLRCEMGYMNGYVPTQRGERVGLYFHEVQPSAEEPYVFTTTWGKDPESQVLMVGGPQFACEGGGPNGPMDRKAHVRIDRLAGDILGIKGKAVALWDGRMGYTRSGVRLAGPDPKNPNLLYNLGCNGIGILHSIYGARRIAKILTGRRTEDSVFDPRHQFREGADV